MARYKGKTGLLTIDDQDLAVKSWDFKHHCDALDVTDTGSGGQRDFEDGLEHCEGKFEAEWKADAAPFGSNPPNVKSGLTPTLELFAKSTDANPCYTGTIFIEDVDVTLDVAGTVKYSVSWKSKPGFVVDDGQSE